jgi:hypothetical protein
MSTLIWTPTETTVRSSNLFALMRERGADSFDAIHAWSVQHSEDFWARTINTLNIRFAKPYPTSGSPNHISASLKAPAVPPLAAGWSGRR